MNSTATSSSVRVYGAAWCEDTQRSRRLLRRLRVPSTYRDVDVDLDALREALSLHPGPRRTPIVVVANDVMAEPDNATLRATLVRNGLLAASDAVAQMKDHNVGDLDRGLRVAAAAGIVLWSTGAPRWLRWPARAGAAVLALTAARAWCPLYDAWQMTSIDGPGDRPDSAERREWLTSTADSPVWSRQ